MLYKILFFLLLIVVIGFFIEKFIDYNDDNENMSLLKTNSNSLSLNNKSNLSLNNEKKKLIEMNQDYDELLKKIKKMLFIFKMILLIKVKLQRMHMILRTVLIK